MYTSKAAAPRVVGRTALFAVLSGTLFPAFSQQANPRETYQPQTFQRTYKASAYVTLFSIPIFSRSGVGYGSALEEQITNRETDTVQLEFVSGSIPERAHGLNRFGYIQESVQERDRTPFKAEYFGVMTASREESLNDAKAALQAQNSGQVPYVAATAEVEHNRAQSSVRHLVLPAPRESGTADLMRLVRASFATRGGANPQDFDKTVAVPTVHTFLYTLRQAILSPAPTSQHQFLYNAKTYRLQTEKHPDPKAEADMQRSGMIQTGTHLQRLSGTIENELTHDRTAFALWYEEGSPDTLPLRFEFRPKSYLKLVFDAQTVSHAAPAMASLAGPKLP